MDEIINPDRLVSVPLSKTRCGVGFYTNTVTNKDIGLALTENKRLETDFFSFYFFCKTSGYLLLSFREIELRDGMVLLLSLYQQQERHADKTALDYIFLVLREGFVRAFTTDKLFVLHLLYRYQTDTPPYISATYGEVKEYMQLLGKIKYELISPVSDTYNIIASLLYHPLLIINHTYVAAYCLPAEIARNNFAFRLKNLLEQSIRTHQRVQGYADMLYVNRITLSNLAKTQFGVSATHLIKQRLLEELKNELLFSNHIVSEMTDDFNLPDPSHLIHSSKQ